MRTLTAVSVVFCSLIFVACFGGGQNTNTSTAPTETPVGVTSAELLEAYKGNAIAADQKYKGRLLAVTGAIQSIEKAFGSSYVTLQGSQPDILSVQCFFPASEDPSLAKLQKGGTCTVVGRCDGKTLNVILKDCKLQ